MNTLWQCRKCLVVYVSLVGQCPLCHGDPTIEPKTGPRRVCEIPESCDIAKAKEG